VKLGGQMKMGMKALLGIMGKRTPVNVMVSITDRCPSRCSYCQIPAQNRPDLTTAQWKDLLTQMQRAGTLRIGVWGGEPLMRHDAVELCAFARELGIYVSLDSNGYLLPARVEILNHIDHLVLAFDGPEKAHDANRESGSYRKLMKAIELASGNIRLWTITVLTRLHDHLSDSSPQRKARWRYDGNDAFAGGVHRGLRQVAGIEARRCPDRQFEKVPEEHQRMGRFLDDQDSR